MVGKKCNENETSRQIAELILFKLNQKYQNMFQLGLTKVFLKEALDNFLEHQCNMMVNGSILIIQKNIRMFIVRIKYLKTRSSIITIQRLAKCWLAR